MSDAPSREGEREECVLVVDDEEGIRETLVEVVEMIGCSAISARDGAEALKVLAERRPCLVILDLLMPVMTGMELIEAMQKDPALATIPVVISTSAPHRAPAGVPVLTKPFDIEAIWGWNPALVSLRHPAQDVFFDELSARGISGRELREDESSSSSSSSCSPSCSSRAASTHWPAQCESLELCSPNAVIGAEWKAWQRGGTDVLVGANGKARQGPEPEELR